MKFEKKLKKDNYFCEACRKYKTCFLILHDEHYVVALCKDCLNKLCEEWKKGCEKKNEIL